MTSAKSLIKINLWGTSYGEDHRVSTRIDITSDSARCLPGLNKPWKKKPPVRKREEYQVTGLSWAESSLCRPQADRNNVWLDSHKLRILAADLRSRQKAWLDDSRPRILSASLRGRQKNVWLDSQELRIFEDMWLNSQKLRVIVTGRGPKANTSSSIAVSWEPEGKCHLSAR